MEGTMFKKMKANPGMSAALLYVPPDYPDDDGFLPANVGKADFVHLFLTDSAEFAERFPTAADMVQDSGLFWLSYPKASGRKKPDINRDSLWALVLPYGWHPVAQIALDETWSAIRLKRNEPGVVYEKPANVSARKQ